MPGMSHCSGGQGPNSFDALTAVINWVEQGTAPASLLTTQTPASAGPVQSLPAYPYPLMATYNGTGDVDVASSYHAALPADLPRGLSLSLYIYAIGHESNPLHQ